MSAGSLLPVRRRRRGRRDWLSGRQVSGLARSVCLARLRRRRRRRLVLKLKLKLVGFDTQTTTQVEAASERAAEQMLRNCSRNSIIVAVQPSAPLIGRVSRR